MFCCVNPTQGLLAPSWRKGRIFDHRQPDLEPSGTSQHLPSESGLCQDLSLPPASSHWWEPRLAQGTAPTRVWPPKNRREQGLDQLMECQCEAARRGRHREGRERTKTQQTARKGLWRCVCLCARGCVRKKRDVRGGRAVTSFHSMNQHVLVCGRATASARSPSHGVRVWKWHRWTKNYHRAPEKNRTTHMFSLYCILGKYWKLIWSVCVFPPSSYYVMAISMQFPLLSLLSFKESTTSFKDSTGIFTVTKSEPF